VQSSRMSSPQLRSSDAQVTTSVPQIPQPPVTDMAVLLQESSSRCSTAQFQLLQLSLICRLRFVCFFLILMSPCPLAPSILRSVRFLVIAVLSCCVIAFITAKITLGWGCLGCLSYILPPVSCCVWLPFFRLFSYSYSIAFFFHMASNCLTRCLCVQFLCGSIQLLFTSCTRL
jgi:hypothetical protein